MSKTLNIPQEKINSYLLHIINDWSNWAVEGRFSVDHRTSFGVLIEVGSKYVKVITYDKRNDSNRSVHSFIVNQKTNLYSVGDILKAASWAAPAKNFARGNIFLPASYENRVRWTGVF